MASLLLLKKRMQAAKNISKTTKALQMIATSKLKKAQDSALLSRPYVDKLSSISQNITSKVDKENLNEYMKANQKTSKPLVILISPDKGLSGALLSNLIKETIEFDEKHKPYYVTIGKKAEMIASKISKDVIATFPFGTSLPSFETVYPIAKIIDEYFLSGKSASVKILTSKYVNFFTQTPHLIDLLPIEPSSGEVKSENDFTLFEPNISNILPSLLKQYLEMIVYQSLLESYASEQAARARAMKDATDNALSVIQELELEYNKTRQEKITNEILDISSSSISL